MPFLSRRFQRRSRDQNRGEHVVVNLGIAGEQFEKFLGARFGAAADHERQRHVGPRHERLEHGAVGGDHADAAVLLPERERPRAR